MIDWEQGGEQKCAGVPLLIYTGSGQYLNTRMKRHTKDVGQAHSIDSSTQCLRGRHIEDRIFFLLKKDSKSIIEAYIDKTMAWHYHLLIIALGCRLLALLLRRFSCYFNTLQICPAVATVDCRLNPSIVSLADPPPLPRVTLKSSLFYLRLSTGTLGSCH